MYYFFFLFSCISTLVLTHGCIPAIEKPAISDYGCISPCEIETVVLRQCNYDFCIAFKQRKWGRRQI